MKSNKLDNEIFFLRGKIKLKFQKNQFKSKSWKEKNRIKEKQIINLTNDNK